ncbi:MAG TPA: DUF5017 domain-containing protein [Flavitalea sp.]|nr:DUF5017 domain-containing protein [Flavitalea sp.]
MNRFTFSIAVLSIFFCSCSKRLGEVKEPDFEVTTEKTTYKAGESVLFNFTNAADIISFYSGAAGNNYLFKDSGQIIPVADYGATLEFSTQLAGTGTQANQLSVWVSNDYDGKTDFASVKAATWTEITSLFKLATSTTILAAGTKDISSYFNAGKPVYIGFKYLTKSQVANQPARIWYVQSLLVKSLAPLVNGQPVLITDHEHSGFQVINQFPVDAPSLSNIAATRITLLGNAFRIPADSTYVPGSPYNDPQTETWAISKALTKSPVTLARDFSIAVKGINTDVLPGFSYTYNAPGTYKAVFIGSNGNVEQTKTVIKELQLVIEP